MDRNYFVLYFYSDKLGHYKTYDFRKFPDAFKHVRLQITFNRCKFHQILPLMVDYACFLVKCINCKSVMCYRKFISCKILQDFWKLWKSCKNAIASKNLASIEFVVRILQDFLNLQKTCKILQEINFLSTRVAARKKSLWTFGNSNFQGIRSVNDSSCAFSCLFANKIRTLSLGA